MTPRYRCPWCPQTFGMAAPFRRHVVGRHGKAIVDDLRPLESFTTRHVGDYPRNAAKRGHVHASGMPCHCGPPRGSVEDRESNRGVSGEGDST